MKLFRKHFLYFCCGLLLLTAGCSNQSHWLNNPEFIRLIATSDIIEIPGQDLSAATNIKARILVTPIELKDRQDCEKDHCYFRYYLSVAEFGEDFRSHDFFNLGIHPEVISISPSYPHADQMEINISFSDNGQSQLNIFLTYKTSNFRIEWREHTNRKET